jgi:hypothetical protein
VRGRGLPAAISQRSGSRKWHPRAGYITFRPFRTGLVCLNVLPAGGGALLGAVAKLRFTGRRLRRQSNLGSSGPTHLIMQLRRLIALLALSLSFSQQLLAQTPTRVPSSGSSAAQTSGVAHNESAKTKCTDNGTYVNSKGQTVPRPENCKAPPKDATAQCRDGTYSFSKSRRGTCSQHGGVGKWL